MTRAPRIGWGGLAPRLRALRAGLPAPGSGWPWLSTALAGLLLMSLLVVEIGFAHRVDAAEREIGAVVAFAIHHPAVELDPRLLPAVQTWLPDFQGNETFSFLRGGESEARQREIDALTESALARVDSHPQRRLGLVPARLEPLDLATHFWVHAGWIHGLGAIALLLCLGPLLERTWGARVTAGLALAGLLLGAGAFAALERGADRPLVGAGAAVAALTAAALIGFRGRRVAPLDWLALELPPVPFWSLGLAWLAWEGLVLGLGGGGLPAGFEPARPWAADLAGLAVGALAALGLERAGVVARPAASEAAAPAGARRSRPFEFDRVVALRSRGQLDQAYVLLEAEAGRSARNRDAVITYFQMSVERGTPERAVPAMRRLISEELRRGAAPVAVGHWRTLCEHVEDPRIDPVLLLRLVPAIREEDGDEIAAVALRQIAARGMERLAPALARQLASLAVGIDSHLCREAARRALAAPDLLADQRGELEAWAAADEDDACEAAGRDTGKRATELPPNVFYDDQDRSHFGRAGGELGELTAPGDEEGPLALQHTTAVPQPEGPAPAPPAAPRVTCAVPLELESDALQVQIPERGRTRVPFEHLHALAAVGVRDLGPRPVVLIDLLVSGTGPDGRPRQVVRLRSDGFDPRPFAPDASSPLAALRAFVAELAFLAGAETLTADGSSIPVYASVEDYTRELLLPAL